MVSRIFSHSSDFGGFFFIYLFIIVVLGYIYIYIYIGHSSSFGSILVILEVMRFFFGLFFKVSRYFSSFRGVNVFLLILEVLGVFWLF